MAGFRGSLALVASALLAGGCGGGGDESPAASGPPATVTTPGIGYVAGLFQPSATFANQCAAPRSGSDPRTNQPFADVQGTELAEKHFLRTWTNELYLWFDEVPERDPASVGGVRSYFDTLKTTVVLPSGRAKDRFHFTYDTAEFRALSELGEQVGYGISWEILGTQPPWDVVVNFVEPGSPAAAAGITRGARLLTADGIDVVNLNSSAAAQRVEAAMSPTTVGARYQFTFRNRGSSSTRAVSLTAAVVVADPVPLVRVLTTALSAKVGYILFNDHVAPAEHGLVKAINQLRSAAVHDLVLDLRYNGGGFLALASELAYMIAGPGPTAGKDFERLQFNRKHPITHPATGEPLLPMPYLSTTQDFSLPAGQALPTLNLGRVYVLTGSRTCSASESIINGLQGAGVQVNLIGDDTCGKPYGFYPRDNCGTTYFSINFRGVNQLGFGDYPEGFSASRGSAPARLPGCAAADDRSRDLGDPNEGRLRAALEYRETGACNVIASATEPETTPASSEAVLRIPDSPWRNNRLLR